MPKAEVGSLKHLSNKMKSKGLQRLRWYCQVCERQMRDENGFKQHTMSEAHVRQMLVVGENSGRYIADYSRQFQRDFLQLLRTSHGEKKVNLNHFYQEYIRNKEHVHLNASKWQSLTEFGKFLGREGICRVEEGDKGLEVAWIDNSPESLRRQDAIRKKERQDKGDEEREQRQIAQQVERAKVEANEKAGATLAADEDDSKMLYREDGEKLKLNFSKQASAPSPDSVATGPSNSADPDPAGNDKPAQPPPTEDKQPPKVGLSFGGVAKSKNVFATASKKNALSAAKPAPKVVQHKPMSEAERIMKEELSRKRMRNGPSLPESSGKRAKT